MLCCFDLDTDQSNKEEDRIDKPEQSAVGLIPCGQIRRERWVTESS